jgi:antirestriction protein ArdC
MTKSAVYESITNRIVSMLESGTVPWRKPWGNGNGKAQNAFSKRPYRGANALLTNLSGYDDPRWATFNQIKAKGGRVKAGQKGTPILFWMQHQIEAKTDEIEDDKRMRTIPLLRLYYVFNIEQTTDLKLPEIAKKTEPANTIEAAEKIVANMPGAPTIGQDGAGQCYYRPSNDSVHMTPLSAFETADSYYSVLFHELTHATGHKSRLDRGLDTSPAPFGSADYSKEELVAEIGSAFLSSEAGIKNDLPNSAAYLSNWLRVLRGDSALIIQAAAKAQKAADYILAKPESI